MLERPQRLRAAPARLRRRRIERRIAARRNPLIRVLQALGRADQRALVALRTRAHTPVRDRVAQGLGTFGELGSGWLGLALAGAALRPERRTRWLRAGAAAPVAVAINYALKLSVGRERPLLEDHPPLSRAPSKLSFPSAHSTSSVAAAVALGRVSPRARPALCGLAGAVCLTRPYLGMHYPSDVLAGATLGLAIGALWPLPAERRGAASAPPAEPAAEDAQ